MTFASAANISEMYVSLRPAMDCMAVSVDIPSTAALRETDDFLQWYDWLKYAFLNVLPYISDNAALGIVKTLPENRPLQYRLLFWLVEGMQHKYSKEYFTSYGILQLLFYRG